MLTLEPLAGLFSVCKVADYTQTNLTAPYCFIGRTGGENSLVCLTQDVPPNTTAREDGWRAFRVAGPLDFSLTGVLAGIASQLAEGGIPLFALSTFDTDYVLCKQAQFSTALDLLSRAGYAIAD